MRDKFCMWLAHKMPKRLLYFATIKAGAIATTGEYSDKTPDEVSIMQVLKCVAV